MIVLGIESSCDETACGIVRSGREVLASEIASQWKAHEVFGGVVPEIAAREHLRVIDAVVEESLRIAGMKISDIDAFAVTQGPGLIGALLVGVSYARALAARTGKPLVPVNHLYAHVHGSMLGIAEGEETLFPCLGFVVSGGHTNLYYMSGVNQFELIARSVDDACGECFDKVAKLLGLSYPGGPIIEKHARSGRPGTVAMPQMVEQRTRLSFSYSGLKTHMVNLLARHDAVWLQQNFADVCASFQEEALAQLVRKLKAAVALRPEARSILVAGGVSANQRFRDLVREEISVRTIFPDLKYCSDNGAMIAASAYYAWRETGDSSSFHWKQSWDAYSRVTEGK